MSEFIVSSFNIRCYGTGGEYDGRMGDEHRDQALYDLIKKHLHDSDIICFQEICQVDRLEKILPRSMIYYTYEHDYKRHQHVVIAVKDKYELVDPFNNNFTIDGVIVNPKTSRPAMYGLLLDKTTIEPVAHIIGVHLKSGRHHTVTRLDQMEKVCEFSKKLDPKIPLIILGDFNTQAKVFTQEPESDILLFDDLVQRYGIKRLENHKDTYKTQWEAHQLDHIFYRGPCRALDEVWVINVDEIFEGHLDKKALSLYYEWVSDHLPIKGRFDLKLSNGPR